MERERRLDSRRKRLVAAAGIRAGHGTGNALPADSERLEKFLLGGAGLVLGLALYLVAPYFYSGGTPYVFADLWTGTCCFLSVAGVAGLLAKWPPAAKWIALVGAFSYGIYLVHQPYVIWLGLRIQDQPVWVFFGLSVIVLVVLSAWGLVLEKFANAMLEKVIGGKKKPA